MARIKAGTKPPTDPTKPPMTQEQQAELDREIESAVAGMTAGAERPPPASPVNIIPRMAEGFHKVMDTVIDENVDVVVEYDLLEAELQITEALTPEVVRIAINKCEQNAKRAHRLYVLAKVQIERLRIDTEVALGSMRDVAVAELTLEKNTGKRTKQVTEADVRERAASKFPDEWREISDNIAKAEAFLTHLQRFADLWQRRSWSLSSLNG